MAEQHPRDAPSATTPASPAARPRGLSVAALLVVFALVIGIPVLAFCAVALGRYAEAERRDTEHLASSVVRSLSTEVDKDLASLTAMLDVLSRSAQVASRDYGGFYEMAVLALGRRDLDVILRDRSGMELVDTRVPWATPLPRLDLPAIDDAVLATRRVHVSGLFPAAPGSRQAFAITAPIMVDGEVTGFLHLLVDPERLRRTLRNPVLAKEWKAAVMDRDFTVLARTDAGPEAVGQGFDLAAARRTAAPEGIWTVNSRDGERMLLIQARSAQSGWTVAAWAPLATLKEPLDRGWWLLAAFGAVSIAFSAVLASLMGRMIARPIHWLAEAGPTLAAGRVFAPIPSYLREANEVAKALFAASVAAQRRDEALHESEARLRSQLHELESVYATAPLGIVALDRQLRLRRMNRRFAQICGLPAGDHLGEPIWDIAPALRARTEAIFHRVLAAGKEERNVDLIGETLASGEAAHHWIGHFYPLVDAERSIVGVGLMVEDVAERRRGERANAQLAALVKASGDAIILLSVKGDILTWNPAAERLFGYAADQAIGRSARMLYAEEGDREFEDNYARLRAGEPVARDSVRRHRDGHALDVSINVAPIFDEYGRLTGFSAVVRDIREQKRRGEHVRLILRELSHRTKNLLAIVLAIARQTALKSEGIDDFQRRFFGRLQGLSHSHDLLVKEDWTGVSIEALVRTQLASFAEMTDANLEIAGPHLRLKPEAAQPLGLALHELATNATKYGALSVPGGRLSVTWRRESDPPRLRMEWRERGGPPVEPPQSKGFGYQLIDWMVASALDGTVSLDFAREGLVWTLDMSLANLADQGELAPAARPAAE